MDSTAGRHSPTFDKNTRQNFDTRAEKLDRLNKVKNNGIGHKKG